MDALPPNQEIPYATLERASVVAGERPGADFMQNPIILGAVTGSILTAGGDATVTGSPRRHRPDRSRRWSMKPFSYASDHPSGIRPNDTELIAVADNDPLLLKVLAEVILGR
jgi:hypothetical protein